MRDWAMKAHRFIEGLSEDQFLHDERSQSAVLHALIVLGEISSRVEDQTQISLRAVPWHRIRGMRNRLAHDYNGVDIDEVWRTVCTDVPALITTLESALAWLEGSSGLPETTG
jgi:uncharacterized protein with HEPN domain